MSDDPWWPGGATVLVTGAGGFVGGHVATALADAGCRVRGLVRRPATPGADSRVEWVVGDLRSAADVAAALVGVRGVVHTAGWVSLGADPRGDSRRVNVDATRDLLDRAEAAGADRFVFTSTLWTVAAGTPDRPAEESTAWNLGSVSGPYCDTKREAEGLVLSRDRPGFRTTALCPGLVVGPGDVRPTSTGLLLTMAGARVALLPAGGIPLVGAQVLARAHVAALERGRGGARYAVVGTYVSYPELARRVAAVAGRPRRVFVIPDPLERPLRLLARLGGRFSGELSTAAVSGGFLRLHVSGAAADREFGLTHPDPSLLIHDALADHRQSGRVRWLGPLTPP